MFRVITQFQLHLVPGGGCEYDADDDRQPHFPCSSVAHAQDRNNAAANHYQTKHVSSIFANTFSGRTSRLAATLATGPADTKEIIRMQSLWNALINYNYHNWIANSRGCRKHSRPETAAALLLTDTEREAVTGLNLPAPVYLAWFMEASYGGLQWNVRNYQN